MGRPPNFRLTESCVIDINYQAYRIYGFKTHDKLMDIILIVMMMMIIMMMVMMMTTTIIIIIIIMIVMMRVEMMPLTTTINRTIF